MTNHFSYFKFYNWGHTSLGVETERPLFVQPGKESDELVGELWTHLEDDIFDLQENPIKTTILGQDVEIHCNVDPSQFDLSTLKKIHACTGAYCLECDHTGKGSFINYITNFSWLFDTSLHHFTFFFTFHRWYFFPPYKPFSPWPPKNWWCHLWMSHDPKNTVD